MVHSQECTSATVTCSIHKQHEIAVKPVPQGTLAIKILSKFHLEGVQQIR